MMISIALSVDIITDIILNRRWLSESKMKLMKLLVHSSVSDQISALSIVHLNLIQICCGVGFGKLLDAVGLRALPSLADHDCLRMVICVRRISAL